MRFHDAISLPWGGRALRPCRNETGAYEFVRRSDASANLVAPEPIVRL
jgi:hypothetical protein